MVSRGKADCEHRIRYVTEMDREIGYSYSRGRWVRGGAGIAAPCCDASGRVAGSIALSRPADRLEDLRIHDVGKAIAEACRGLSHRLGYVEPS